MFNHQEIWRHHYLMIGWWLVPGLFYVIQLKKNWDLSSMNWKCPLTNLIYTAVTFSPVIFFQLQPFQTKLNPWQVLMSSGATHVCATPALWHLVEEGPGHFSKLRCGIPWRTSLPLVYGVYWVYWDFLETWMTWIFKIKPGRPTRLLVHCEVPIPGRWKDDSQAGGSVGICRICRSAAKHLRGDRSHGLPDGHGDVSWDIPTDCWKAITRPVWNKKGN